MLSQIARPGVSRSVSSAAPAAVAAARSHWFAAPPPNCPIRTANVPLTKDHRETGSRGFCTATEAPAPAPARHVPTIEVIVSKIFPAGFGWQGASVIAGNQGFEADTLAFALTTGAGDFAGVFTGHLVYTTLKAAVSGKPDPVGGLWLATAAFCSGTAWQPVVNFLHDGANCSFTTTAVGCGAATGTAFFVGLRIGRVLYKPLGLEGATYSNLCGDAMLSASIGAATGTFVGTDISFGAANFLRPFFGVEDSMSDIEGMVRAGASTSAGFFVLQTLQNVLLPTKANWLDPVEIAPEK